MIEKKSLRCVIDTNVWISYLLLPQSKPATIVKHLLANGVILLSTDTENELQNVLNRKKFDRYLVPDEKSLFLTKLKKIVAPVVIIKRFTLCRDKKDNAFIELAINGKADVLITGDNDLLTLNNSHNLSIVTPHDFIEQYIDNP